MAPILDDFIALEKKQGIQKGFGGVFQGLWLEEEICFAIAGGGCKAFYGLGFGHEMKSWGLKFKEVSGVSAGAAMVLCLICGNEEECVSFFENIVRKNPANFYLSRLFKGGRVFPHEEMYRKTIRFGIDFQKIVKSEIKVFIHTLKAIPKEDSLRNKFRLARLIAETAKAFLEDERDKKRGLNTERMQRILRKWNMKEVLFTKKDFDDEKTVEQIILNSSSVPPVVSVQSHEKEYYFDGGLTNNLLLEVFPPDKKTIGVYYEPTTIVGKDPKLLERCYLQTPSEPLPITSFDYTDPNGVRRAYELGKRDAQLNKDKIFEYLKKDWAKAAFFLKSK
ncbi:MULTISPECIES: patatin-like phospholipase family protein [Leptospira]|uniref:Phospholipase, patatin family n=1 Tax=Leptospira borgpetersenii serovar Ballum TaxID=280505 RepID=A0A0E3BJB8_LEPBO|nr:MULTISPECIES: patatin-like phospholipase family protein [Leptospira]EMO09968.1 phospholipase, patatin family [Leptospira borgpetersenii str. Noumea 25]ALO28265.1 phospholipase, patatin family [Leptospira borgpetersenii serovar Ballum]ANH02363.1 Phospholipase, patatin family [Leptospira borgpetersenii str. 4E]AXX17537.1 phospholipase [Leptospira borgpetersenii serovar Ceylonica]EKQ93492.1 phospholipase, patatin family [Leptospira borgpetersenii str. UI 09149]